MAVTNLNHLTGHDRLRADRLRQDVSVSEQAQG
jgi:hypothetical protein